MRTFLSMLLGLLIAGVVVVGVVMLAQELFPVAELPAGQESEGTDPIPLPVLLTFPIAFTLGALIGAAVGGRVAHRGWQPVVVTVGAVLVVAAGIVMLQFPHPLWVWISAVVAPIPAAWFGGLMTHNLVRR